ncbi:MAG: bifunctional hydroxymethylpyrimidine kinase/phosphomethylpyrimidine kinase [Deltaproteobacteria bacterium]|nr:bifunctional hydroxymethylpyrimidine kinase/phosphomethylpyrimidine kinase [Deltaproteobacteria bacterium]
MKKALSIAGFDPTGGAGVMRDSLVFAAFGVTPLSLITALTAQDGKIFTAFEATDAALLKKQADALLKKHKIAALKTGMLANEAITKTVCDVIKRYKIKNVVVDPVLASSSGFPLYGKKLTNLKKLISIATLVTPNIPEAEKLTGVKIKTTEDIKAAALLIKKLGVKYVLIKGGHLKGDAIDTLFDGRKFYYFKGKRIKGSMHGTGCALSSAIAANIANGKSIESAIKTAKKYVTKLIKEAAQKSQ